MVNTTIKFYINDTLVCSEQFSSKTQLGLDKAVGHYKSQMEFAIRATLRLSGCQEARLAIVEGILKEAKIIRW